MSKKKKKKDNLDRPLTMVEESLNEDEEVKLPSEQEVSE